MTPHRITQAIANAWPMVTDDQLERGQLLELLTTSDAAMADDQVTDLAIFAHAALHALENGQATDIDVNNLALISDVAALLADVGYGAEALPDLVAGQNACRSLRDRHARTGRAVCTGPELQHLRMLVFIHEQQLQLRPTAREMRMVISEIRGRLVAGKVM